MVFLGNLLPILGALFVVLSSSSSGARMVVVLTSSLSFVFSLLFFVESQIITLLHQKFTYLNLEIIHTDQISGVFGVLVSFLFFLFVMLDFAEERDDREYLHLAFFLIRESAVLLSVSVKPAYFFYFSVVALVGINFLSIGKWCIHGSARIASRYLSVQTVGVSILFLLFTFLKIKYHTPAIPSVFLDIGGVLLQEKRFLGLLFLLSFAILWGLVPLKDYFMSYMNRFSVESVSIFASGAIVALYGIIRFVLLFSHGTDLVDVVFSVSLVASVCIIIFATRNQNLNLLFAAFALYFVYPMLSLFESSQDSVIGYILYCFGGVLIQIVLVLFISLFKKNLNHEFDDSCEIFFKNKVYQSLLIFCLFIVAGFPISIGFNGLLTMLFSLSGKHVVMHGVFFGLSFVAVFWMIRFVCKRMSLFATIDVNTNKNIFLREKLVFEFLLLSSLIGASVFLGFFPGPLKVIPTSFFKEVMP